MKRKSALTFFLYLAGILFFILFYLAIWPIVWHLLILPHAQSEKHQLRVESYSPNKVVGTSLFLDKPDSSLSAYAVWQVPVGGLYRFKLSCDDNGKILIDSRPVIVLKGVSPNNIGETKKWLTPGSHFLELHLNNILEKGWFKIEVAGPDQADYSPLRIDELSYLEIVNIETWLKVVSWGEYLCLLGVFGFILLWVHVHSYRMNGSQVSYQGAHQTSFIKRALWGFYIIIFFLIFSLVAMIPFAHINGWPANHDGIVLFERVGVFYQEMLKGNLFPLWTSYGQNGYGSAFPFLYHRFFNSFAAFLTFFTGHVYYAVKLSIPLLLCFGAIGMFKLIEKAGLSLRYSLYAGILFIFANYTYTDWLIRGSVAEFTAMMFLPWLFYSCLCLTDNNKFAGIKIGLVMACIFYAHIVIFYYAILCCAVFYFISIFQKKRYLCLKNYFDLFLTMIILFLFCGVYTLGILLFKKMYNFSILTKETANLIDNLAVFEEYLINRSYHFGENWGRISVEIGRVFNLFSIFFTLVALFLVFSNKIKLRENTIKFNGYLPLFICIIIFTGLQTSLAKPFYLYFPGASFIQFPWRLLTFSTILSITALCLSINLVGLMKGWTKRNKLAQVALFFATFYQVIFGVTIPINYEIMERAYIDEKMQPKNLIVSEEPSEYRPKDGVLPAPAPSLIEVEGNCTIVNISPQGAMKTLMDANHIIIELQGQCRVLYNQFINPFTEISFSTAGEVQKSNKNTYVLLSDLSEKQEIKIKRVGLIKSINNYFLRNNKKIYE